MRNLSKISDTKFAHVQRSVVAAGAKFVGFELFPDVGQQI
jgi:hypothetical protein